VYAIITGAPIIDNDTQITIDTHIF